MLRLAACSCILLLAAGCSGRYVGPGSGTRDERVEKREQQRIESTEPTEPQKAAQTQREIDNSGIPVAP